MVKDGVKGKVILVTSTAALIGYGGNAQYVATKFALRGNSLIIVYNSVLWDQNE
jgi:short-subunit dehydrogenase